MNNASRIRELDSLRGIAAGYVMLHHYLERYSTTMNDRGAISIDLPISGQFAVHLFFVISGFVIMMSLQRCSSVSQFVFSRFVRLFPTYWTSIAATCLCICLFRVADRQTLYPSVAQIAANASMLHSYFAIPSIDSVYWSLGVELAFYFWISLCFATVGLVYIFRLSWLWLLICLVAFFFQDYSRGYPIPAGTSFSYALDSGALLRFAPLFIAGIAFYKLKTKEQGAWQLHSLIWVTFAVYLLVVVYPGMRIGPKNVTIALSLYTAFYLLTFDRLRFVAVEPLVFLGTISYSLYTTHSVAGNHFRHWLRFTWGLTDYLALPLTIVFALVLATTITFLIERPCNRFFRVKRGPARGRKHPSPDDCVD